MNILKFVKNNILIFLLLFIVNVQASDKNVLEINELKKQAPQGDAKAQYSLAINHHGGKNLDKKSDKEIRRLREAANQGVTNSQLQLAKLLFKRKDYLEARYWFEMSSMQGNSEAQFNLAYIYLRGLGGLVEVEKAKLWLEKIVDQSNDSSYIEKARISLGIILLEKSNSENDYKKAKELFEEEGNNSTAKYYLGVIHYKGLGVEKNFIEAERFFKEAAKENDINILRSIGSIYKIGLPDEEDFYYAWPYYKKAADLGDIKSQEILKNTPKYNSLIRKLCFTDRDFTSYDGQYSKTIKSIITVLSYSSIYRFFTDRDSAVESYLKKSRFDPKHYKNLSDSKEKLTKEDKEYLYKYTDHYERVFNIQKNIINSDITAKKILEEEMQNFCFANELIYSGKYFDPDFKFIEKEKTFSDFDVRINSCNVVKSISGKHNTTPDKIEGTRFAVIDSNFKNISHTPKRVYNGYITIRTIDNKLYKFENEDVFISGFSVSSKKINPLISRNEKILFRIPDDLYGRIEWHPDLDFSGDSLWCGFASPSN